MLERLTAVEKKTFDLSDEEIDQIKNLVRELVRETGIDMPSYGDFHKVVESQLRWLFRDNEPSAAKMMAKLKAYWSMVLKSRYWEESREPSV